MYVIEWIELIRRTFWQIVYKAKVTKYPLYLQLHIDIHLYLQPRIS